jgi:hypothetical protein
VRSSWLGEHKHIRKSARRDLIAAIDEKGNAPLLKKIANGRTIASTYPVIEDRGRQMGQSGQPQSVGKKIRSDDLCARGLQGFDDVESDEWLILDNED